MKPLFLIPFICWAFASSSAHGYFYELECTANFQTRVGVGTIEKKMNKVSPGKFGDEKYTADLEGFVYEMVLHEALDTLYMTIKKDDHKLLFSTARVPTFGHNDSMADVTLMDGTRRWISCANKPTKK